MNNKIKYTIYGASFGLLFPIMATWIWAIDNNCSLWDAQTTHGHILVWIINTAPLFLGLFASFAGIRQDQLEARLDLERHKSDMNAKLATVGEVSGQMAHELNNPLSALNGFLYIIKREVQNPDFNMEKINLYIEKSEKVINRTSKIIKGIKDLSRDSSHDDLVKVNLKNIIEDSIELCESTLKSKNIKISTKDLVDVEVKCNPIQISQVILNLINNAKDAIHKQEEPWIEISLNVENPNIQVIVKDSGPGIPHEISQKLFEPFFTTKPLGVGTGLGLNISQNIINKHGGKINYQLDNGHTCFLISLPISDFIQ